MRLAVAISILVFAVINMILGLLLFGSSIYILATVAWIGYIPSNSYFMIVQAFILITSLFMVTNSTITFIAIYKRSNTIMKVAGVILGIFLIFKMVMVPFLIANRSLVKSEIPKFLGDAVTDKRTFIHHNVIRPIDLIQISVSSFYYRWKTF